MKYILSICLLISSVFCISASFKRDEVWFSKRPSVIWDMTTNRASCLFNGYSTVWPSEFINWELYVFNAGEWEFLDCGSCVVLNEFGEWEKLMYISTVGTYYLDVGVDNISTDSETFYVGPP